MSLNYLINQHPKKKKHNRDLELTEIFAGNAIFNLIALFPESTESKIILAWNIRIRLYKNIDLSSSVIDPRDIEVCFESLVTAILKKNGAIASFDFIRIFDRAFIPYFINLHCT